MKNLTILTCDPSFTAFGYAVVQNDIVLEHGCIKTTTEGKKRRIRKSDETAQRISLINSALLKVISYHKVNYIVSEAPHGSQSATAAVMVGAMAGIMQTISDCLNIPIEFYSEGDAKKAVLGTTKNTSKKAMLTAVNKLYDVEWSKAEFRNEAVADALAVYHVASKESPTIRFYKSGIEREPIEITSIKDTTRKFLVPTKLKRRK